METEATRDPAAHSRNMQQRLEEIIRHARDDAERVREPRFQALLETTAEVLTGLRTAYQHYDQKNEPAWRENAAGRP